MLLRFKACGLLCMVVTVSSCDSPSDLGLHDGYATVAGSLLDADQNALASVDVRLACGPAGPTLFGSNDRTNEQGEFRIEAAAPDGTASIDAESFSMRCRLLAASGPEVIATRYAEITFKRSRDDQIVTNLDLTEGSIEPPPESWTLP